MRQIEFVSSLNSSNSCNVAFSIFIVTAELAIFISNNKKIIKNRGIKKNLPPRKLSIFGLHFALLHFFLLSTRYATANSPAIANTASKPGGSGVGLGVGVGVGATAGGVGVGVTARVGVGVGVAAGFNAKHAAQSGFGSHGSFSSVPAIISCISE